MTAAVADGGGTGLVINIRRWQGVGVWTWNAGDKDDVCGICRVAFDACPPEAKFPGDDSPVVWGQCGHAFHLQCITKWLNSQAEQRCPICRGAWEFKQLNAAGEEGGARTRAADGEDEEEDEEEDDDDDDDAMDES
jgi:anaphase-promoting complex subunit 11